MRSLDYEVYMSGSVSTLNLVVSYPVSTRIGVWFIWDYWLVTVLVLLLAQSSSEIPVSILLLLPTLVKLNVHTSSQLLPCHQWPWWHTIFWMHYLRIRNGIICWSYQLLQLEGLKFVPQVVTFPWPFRTSILLCGLPVSPMHLSSVTSALPGLHTSKLEIDYQKHCDIIWISSNNPILSTWSSFGYHPPEISINKKQITRDNLLADFIHLWCHNLPPFNLHHPSNVHN